MMKIKFMVLLVVFLIAPVGIVVADDKEGDNQSDYSHSSGEHSKGKFFARLDHDKDGALSFDEKKKGIKHIFGRLDKNKDGKVDQAEKPVCSRRFRMLDGLLEKQSSFTEKDAVAYVKKNHTLADSNKDGKVDRDEAATAHKKRYFSDLDTNADGALSPAEFSKKHDRENHKECMGKSRDKKQSQKKSDRDE